MTTIEIKHKTADNLFRVHQLVEALEIQSRIAYELIREVNEVNPNLNANMKFAHAFHEISKANTLLESARMDLDRVNVAFQNREIICKE